ncbi:MAG: hypothetical protein M5Z89_10135 [Olivibacter sp.]|nr:hypothetical protein [Olivibacter sp. UJ_SKK_5.1]
MNFRLINRYPHNATNYYLILEKLEQLNDKFPVLYKRVLESKSYILDSIDYLIEQLLSVDSTVAAYMDTGSIINPNALSYDGRLGQELVSFLSSNDLYFILCRKEFCNARTCKLHVVVTYEDYILDDVNDF